MRRDANLIRDLLLKSEWDGYECQTEEEKYHARLIEQAGWGMLQTQRTKIMDVVVISGLTHEGSEFVELIRDKEKWDHAVLTVAESTGGTNLQLIREVLLSRGGLDAT